MRRLLYIPIIHTDLDLGTLASEIDERARAIVGAIKWQRHKEVVQLYWQVIADYWQSKDVRGFKIFQDGMPVDGEAGQKIVQSLASEGSINYKIIRQLLEHGAELIATEDAELLKEEYFLTQQLSRDDGLSSSSPSTNHQLNRPNFFRARPRKDQLLQARDTYIAKRIAESLGEGETGICFLGAYHSMLSRLPRNIAVIALKDPEKVRDYYQKLTSNRWEREVARLSAYLTKPISLEPGEENE